MGWQRFAVAHCCLLNLNANAPCITALLYFVFACCIYSVLAYVSYPQKKKCYEHFIYKNIVDTLLPLEQNITYFIITAIHMPITYKAAINLAVSKRGSAR